MPNFELMLWIILTFWVINGILNILSGLVLRGEEKTWSLADTASGIVLIILAFIILTVS